MHRGLTLIEIIVSISILLIVLAIGLLSFSDAKNKKELHSTADTLILRMEEMKTNAISGKGGSSFGVKFNTDSYTLFQGSSYNISDPENIVHDIPDIFEINTTIENSDVSIVFERLSGEASSSDTITISEISDPSNTISISIGSLGNISIVE